MKKKVVKSKSKEPKVDLDLDSERYMLSKEARLALIQADAFRIPALEELTRFQEQLQQFNRMPFEVIEEALRPLKLIQEAYILPMQRMAEMVHKSIYESGFMQIANSLKSLQIEAFAGVIIKSELQNNVASSLNGIQTTSHIRKTGVLATGEVELNIQKNTETDISMQVAYRKLETIDTKLQLVDDNLKNVSSKEDIKLVMRLLERQDSLINIIQNNPFPYFRINTIGFIKEQSYFVINGGINIKIPSKSLQDYICQVLFSGAKENLTDEWFVDEIIDELKPFLGDAELKRLNWSKLKEAIININEKIAMETTKKDVIRIPRPEIVQLNFEYFSSKTVNLL